MDDNARYARGLRERRAVLGRAHVDGALAAATDLDRDFQHLLTRYVWGEIWTRPGLPRKTRRLVVLATLVALDRLDELRIHVRAAAEAGVSRAEIREVLLQCSAYCGIPAARSAFAAASEVLDPAPARRRARRKGPRAAVVRKKRR